MKPEKIDALAIGDRLFLSASIYAVKRADDPAAGGRWEIVGGDLVASFVTIRDGQIITGITLGSLVGAVERDHF